MRYDLVRSGVLIVISAPSGGGKSEVLKRLLAEDPRIRYSVSYTSRAPRGDEVDGVNYHFVSRDEFKRLIAADAFYEWAEVHGNLYGTSAKVVEESIGKGQDIAMDIDVQGGLNIKRRQPNAALIFLMPPSMTILEQRLRGRASDDEEQVRLRLKNANQEIERWKDYDYVVTNEDIERTVAQVKTIVEAARLRTPLYQMRPLP
jgi:guanylate kinase